MEIRKTAVAGVALVASLAFLAGCSSDTSSSPGQAAPSAAAGAKPAEELTAAVMKLGTTTHKYTVKVGTTDIFGQVDPATKAIKLSLATAEQGAQITADLVAIDTDYYAKVAGLPLPGIQSTKWYHLDGRRTASLQLFGISSLTDPVGVVTLASTVKNVEKTATGYKGTIDLSKPASGFTGQDIKDLAEKAQNIPFEATVDAQGQLSTFKFTVPAHGTDKETAVVMTITDHGAPVEITKPAAEQTVEAPEMVYQLFGPQ